MCEGFYTLSMKAEIKLDSNAVLELITSGLKARGIYPSKVTLECGMEYEDRPCGSSYPVFKSAIVEIEVGEKP